jgi:hypothetical protein
VKIIFRKFILPEDDLVTMNFPYEVPQLQFKRMTLAFELSMSGIVAPTGAPI